MMNDITQARSTARTTGQISAQDISGVLSRVLGAQLLSLIVGESVEAIQGWSTGSAAPSDKSERRLRNAYGVYDLLRKVEDTSPAEALADDQVRNVMVSARAFVGAG